jgi:hypothetical protein
MMHAYQDQLAYQMVPTSIHPSKPYQSTCMLTMCNNNMRTRLRRAGPSRPSPVPASIGLYSPRRDVSI